MEPSTKKTPQTGEPARGQNGAPAPEFGTGARSFDAPSLGAPRARTGSTRLGPRVFTAAEEKPRDQEGQRGAVRAPRGDMERAEVHPTMPLSQPRRYSQICGGPRRGPNKKGPRKPEQPARDQSGAPTNGWGSRARS